MKSGGLCFSGRYFETREYINEFTSFRTRSSDDDLKVKVLNRGSRHSHIAGAPDYGRARERKLMGKVAVVLKQFLAGTFWQVLDTFDMHAADQKKVMACACVGFEVFGDQPMRSFGQEGFRVVLEEVLFTEWTMPLCNYFLEHIDVVVAGNDARVMWINGATHGNPPKRFFREPTRRVRSLQKKSPSFWEGESSRCIRNRERRMRVVLTQFKVFDPKGEQVFYRRVEMEGGEGSRLSGQEFFNRSHLVFVHVGVGK
jgi:hypothetical protein